MNISAVFIRRPVMTTLLMLAIVLFGVMAYRALPVSDLPNVDFPTIQVTASLPGASPETMASAVATPLEKQFSTIAGLDSMTSTNSARQHADHAPVRSRPRHRRRRAGRAGGDRAAAAPAAAGHADAAVVPEGQSGRPADPLPGADARRRCRCRRSTSTPRRIVGAAHLDGQRRGAGAGLRRAEVRGARRRSTRTRSRRASIGIDEVATADRSRQRQPARPARSYGPDRDVHASRPTGQLTNAAAFRPLDRRLPQRRAGPARASSATSSTASRTTRPRAGSTTTRGDLPRPSSASPAPTPSRSSTRSSALLPRSRPQLPPSVQHGHPLRPLGVDPRVGSRRASSRWCSTLGLVVLVIFLFLRNVSATLIPSLALPFSIVGTFAVDVPARLQPRQPVADGADALGRLRRRRRHRDAREHRPPHGDGREPRCRRRSTGSQEIGFTIVSMTLSLAAVFIPVLFMGGILGRLFHEFAVTIGVAILISGFVSLTLTPMLCSRFLQPPARHAARPRLHGDRARLRRGCATPTTGRCDRRCATTRVTMAVSRAAARRDRLLFRIIPKGFIPERGHRPADRSRPRRRRALASRRWSRISCAGGRASSAPTRTSSR